MAAHRSLYTCPKPYTTFWLNSFPRRHDGSLKKSIFFGQKYSFLEAEAKLLLFPKSPKTTISGRYTIRKNNNIQKILNAAT